MPPVFHNRYGQAAIVLLIIFGIGRTLWGWGFITAAYGLIVYLIIAIGIRVDEMARDIRSLREIRSAEAEQQTRMIHRLDQISAALIRIDHHLTHSAPSIGSDDPIAPKVAPRD